MPVWRPSLPVPFAILPLQFETVREFEPVGNALCGVPVRSAASRNGTEAVPYKGLRRFEFSDTLIYLYSKESTNAPTTTREG